MALHLGSSVAELPGIGGKALQDLKNLDITCVRDLLWYVPFRYDDFSKIRGAGEARIGEMVTIEGEVRSIQSRPSKSGRVKLVEAIVGDDTGEIKVMWFNQSYLERTLPPGSHASFAGQVDGRFGRCLVSPIVERDSKHVHTGRIVPVYGLTGSITMRRLRDAIRACLSVVDEIVDWVPKSTLEQESYPSLSLALRNVHFPENRDALDGAIARLKFDELFLHQLMFAAVRQERCHEGAFDIMADAGILKEFVSRLPFELTVAQRKAIWEIAKDMNHPHPMNRLLQGDVGSGKSVVAAACAQLVVEEGNGVAYLAPTEILASQQYQAFSCFLDCPVALLTRSQHKIDGKDATKEAVIEAIRSGKIKVVIGTHALLQDRVEIPKMALVIVDEQHRFGVEQRHALLTPEHGRAPHLLSMTATPIPRSLALTLYGDLNLSVLDQMPIGRKPVATALVPESQRAGMWKHVREQVTGGRQVFVVCPLIDPSDKLGVRSVVQTEKELASGSLKGLKLGVLHGRMKPDEKEGAVRSFRDGKLDVLVATTVVEVGVDIPNASVMVIVGAERFGLSQLHQLRGRVGRSDIQSYCYLLPEQLSGSSEERLRAMERTVDGFELAEIDLKLRGPGNVFGNSQSGFPDFQLATPADVDVMKKAREHSAELIGNDPGFDNHPMVRERISQSFEEVHLE
jgi:ATP-dependent DNA helicase RecG